jgi:DHA3 family macrolide efflux protein-like MFS transporter
VEASPSPAAEAVSEPPVSGPPDSGPPDSVRLLNRNFVLLWVGQTISQLGNQAYALAVSFWLMEKTGSASLMGLLMTVSNLPGVVLAPFGGTFADRHSRIRIIIACDLIAGIGLLGLTAIAFLAPERVHLLVTLLFCVAVLLGVNRSFFMPAIAACIPDLVSKPKLAAANSINQFSLQTAVFVGQATGGVLYRLLGAPMLFLIDGLSFFVSAASSMFIRLPEKLRQRDAAKTGREAFRSFMRDTGEGFQYVWVNRGLRNFVLSVSVINLLIMPVVVLLPFYVSLFLHKDAAWFGFLMAAISVGAVAGFLMAGSLKLQGQARARGILAGLIVLPLIFGTIGFLRVPAAALAGAFLAGAVLGFINVQFAALVQGSTPRELRGRVLGLLNTMTGGLIPIGMALGGFAGDLTHKNVPLVYAVCGALAMVAVLFTASRRESREYLANG